MVQTELQQVFSISVHAKVKVTIIQFASSCHIKSQGIELILLDKNLQNTLDYVTSHLPESKVDQRDTQAANAEDPITAARDQSEEMQHGKESQLLSSVEDKAMIPFTFIFCHL